MKRHTREWIIVILQGAMFWIGPCLAGPTEVMAIVLLMLLGTVALAFALGLICGDRRKYMYPIVPALLFLPTVPVYYNESALVHALWHMAAAAAGLMVGSGVRAVWKLCWKK